VEVRNHTPAHIKAVKANPTPIIIVAAAAVESEVYITSNLPCRCVAICWCWHYCAIDAITRSPRRQETARDFNVHLTFGKSVMADVEIWEWLQLKRYTIVGINPLWLQLNSKQTFSPPWLTSLTQLVELENLWLSKGGIASPLYGSRNPEIRAYAYVK